MSGKILKPIFILIISAFIISCSTQKSAAKNAEEKKALTIINNSLKQKPIFTNLTIQSKIQADIDGNSIGLNGKIYIQNGNKIWVNVSKFGINAARALITPSGFKAYEKLDRTYIDGDFSYFNHLLKVDFIDYQTLQNLLLGRIFTEMTPSEFLVEIVDNQYILSYKENENLISKPKDGKYIQTYRFGTDYLLREAVIRDPKTNMELQVDFSNWLNIGTQPFPKNVKVLVKDKKTQQVDLEYNNFTFEQSETPFEIPSDYKPNQLFK